MKAHGALADLQGIHEVPVLCVGGSGGINGLDALAKTVFCSNGDERKGSESKTPQQDKKTRMLKAGSANVVSVTVTQTPRSYV